VSDCLTPNEQFLSAIYVIVRRNYISMRWSWCPLCTRQTHLVELFYMLSYWTNRPRVDMSLHSDTLSWFRAQPALTP